MAAKNAGVQYADFMKTHHSRWSDSSGGWQKMTHARWRGLNNHTGHTLGKPFLSAAAQASGNLSEDLIRAIRFKVAYELDTTGVPSMEINDHYLTGAVDVSTIKERAIVLVSNMGHREEPFNARTVQDVQRPADRRYLLGLRLSGNCDRTREYTSNTTNRPRRACSKYNTWSPPCSRCGE